MSAGFTPGPWRVSNKGRRVQPSVFGADDTPVASCGGNAPGHGQYTSETYQRRDANARLIATAPEMFDALEKCAALIDGVHGDIARAVLAKARGF